LGRAQPAGARGLFSHIKPMALAFGLMKARLNSPR
jgi:hypothetical protein